MLNYHRDWYVENNPEKHRNKIYQGRGGQWFLTIAEKKQILLNNIFGVDIDSQAVEVTKLSLLLKVLEGETSETIGQTYKIFHERALPDLGNNIKCGNSLIGPDFFENKDPDSIDPEEYHRINPFNWKAEFPQIFKRNPPGFDTVIGNPPYVVIDKGSFRQPITDYLLRYEVSEYKTDLFQLFIQRGVQLLAKGGLFGYIVPNPWLTQKFAKVLREFILHKTSICEIVVFRQMIFPTSNVHTCLLFLENSPPELDHQIMIKNPTPVSHTRELVESPSDSVSQHEWLKNVDFRFETRLGGRTGNLVRKIVTEYPPLSSLARASLGCQAYNRSKHTPQQIAKRVFHSDTKLSHEYLPELAGSDVTRYQVNRKRGSWIKYGPWLHDYRTMDWLQGPRILVREVAGKPPYQLHACYVEETYCNYKTILNVNPSSSTRFSMKYLVGILNSKLLSFLHPYMSDKMVALSFPRLTVADLRKLPIKPIAPDDPKDLAKHDKMVKLVERMLDLHKRLAKEKVPAEKTRIQRQINTTDKQIDKLTYELYNLTPKEIKIIEETT